MSAAASVTCEAANLFGWYVGGASATIADIVLLLRFLLTPALGPTRPPTPDPMSKARRVLHALIWLMPIIWAAGAAWLGGAFPVCYGRGVAISATIVFGVLLVISIVTAANQIARRSVR